MFEVWERADLLRGGLTSRRITRAVRDGRLLRPRQGIYLPPDAPSPLVGALRVGGRLDCLSLLRELGVFVFDSSSLHVRMTRGSSRMRSAGDVRMPLAPRHRREQVQLHWRALVEPPSLAAVSVVDALVHSVRCQSPRHTIATIDSALHLGLIDLGRLREAFQHEPARFSALLPLVDPRAESGPETLVRLIARALGYVVELQVSIQGVGRVDLLLDGWLVVECDSKSFHSSWEQRQKDYRRDRELAAQGYSVLRLTARDIMHEPEVVVAALRGLRSRR